MAALTPDEFHVDIWDEFVRGPVENSESCYKYDLIGVTSSRVTLLRAMQLVAFFRQQGILTAVGGLGFLAAQTDVVDILIFFLLVRPN